MLARGDVVQVGVTYTAHHFERLVLHAAEHSVVHIVFVVATENLVTSLKVCAVEVVGAQRVGCQPSIVGTPSVFAFFSCCVIHLLGIALLGHNFVAVFATHEVVGTKP